MLIVIPLMQIVSWGLSAVPADLPPQSLVSNWRVTIAVVSSAEVGAVDGRLAAQAFREALRRLQEPGCAPAVFWAGPAAKGEPLPWQSIRWVGPEGDVGVPAAEGFCSELAANPSQPGGRALRTRAADASHASPTLDLRAWIAASLMHGWAHLSCAAHEPAAEGPARRPGPRLLGASFNRPSRVPPNPQ